LTGAVPPHAATMRAHVDGVHPPGVRTHGRPRSHDERRPRLRRDARRRRRLR